MLFSGIGGVAPRAAASALRQRARAHTSVLGTSLIGANPPAESPYRVEKPVASWLLLPVVSTRCPCSLDNAISAVPRTRACRFSSATPCRPVSYTHLTLPPQRR